MTATGADSPTPPELARLGSAEWPRTIALRPGLAELGQQTEDLLMLIAKLPYDDEIPRSKHVGEYDLTANVVRAKVGSRASILGLGKNRGPLLQYLYGTGSARRLWLIAEPAESPLLRDLDRVDAEELRAELSHLILADVARAVEDRYARRGIELPGSSETPAERRGTVRLGWDSDPEEEPHEG